LVPQIRRTNCNPAARTTREKPRAGHEFIAKLPKAEHTATEWQTAMEALLLAVRGAPTVLARIGIMKALHRHDVRKFKSSEKKTHWGKRRLVRDR
jgi:hypothetical protein